MIVLETSVLTRDCLEKETSELALRKISDWVVLVRSDIALREVL